MCSPYLPLFSPCCLVLPARQSCLFCLFASSPPSLPLYLSLECRCLVKITLAMPCYANDYQLSTCLPLLLQQLPIQTCQNKCLSCIPELSINKFKMYISLHCMTSRRVRDHLKLTPDKWKLLENANLEREGVTVCVQRAVLSHRSQNICNQ